MMAIVHSIDISLIEPPKWFEANYGIRGVDYVKARRPLWRLTLALDIDGDITSDKIDAIVSAAKTAAEQ